jgi:addiction module HigA family antidote
MSKSSITIDKVRLPAIHPGEILAEELATIGVSANALARDLDVPSNRVTAILAGKRGITADTALRLAKYFGTSARLWMNLQAAYDLATAEAESGARIGARVRPRAA